MKISVKNNNLLNNLFIYLYLLLVAIVAFTFVYQRGQDSNWDLLNYHYFSGYSLLHGRYMYDISPVNIQSFFNPVVNSFSYISLAHLHFPFSAWLILLFQLFSLPILVLIGRQIAREMGFNRFGLIELLGLTLCLMAPLWWSELGTTFFSSTLTPLILLGLYYGLLGITDDVKSSKYLILSGLLFGLATGLKLTNAPFAIGFFVASIVVIYLFKKAHVINFLLKVLIGMFAGFLITAWWNFHLLNNWGSPMFPLYNSWFKSPYYDQINWRDMRWYFSSISDFGLYLYNSAFGTVKTSEISFADPRLLIIFIILPSVILLRKKTEALGKGALLLIIFVGVSFTLWSVMLAYQRYLIPIEVLFGFVIWILLSKVTSNRNLMVFLLTSCIIGSSVFIKIPDWGHFHSHETQENSFGLKLPTEFSSTPARYLVLGSPLGYILPFLHPKSYFYGLGFSSQVDKIIVNKLSQENDMPIRILINESSSSSIWQQISKFGFEPEHANLSCSHFHSRIDSYMICNIEKQTSLLITPILPVEINFYGSNTDLPSTVLNVNGLSEPETWGRWSSGDEVNVTFANCLPKGKVRIDVRGHAFGPNIGADVPIGFSANKAALIFSESDSDQTVVVENNEQCQLMISISIPQKTSPKMLGLSSDARELGVALVQLKISKLQ